MPKIHQFFLALTITFTSYSTFACLWDSDTLTMERSRFPTVLELITGKFLRHSKEFYQWRIQDRLTKLKYEPNNLAYYDDLAVAYDKIDEHQKAIETILKKDDIKPGLYETEANLGTFFIHSGQFEQGLIHIGKAIQINPDAHFGREKYQKYLVEYVLSCRINGTIKLPLKYCKVDQSNNEYHPMGFEYFLKEHQENDYQAALKGILGMMKFGNYQSPILS